MLSGKKQFVAYDDLIDAVLTAWPGAYIEGAIGTKHAVFEGVLVAEAWLHRTRPGWWLRLAANPATLE